MHYLDHILNRNARLWDIRNIRMNLHSMGPVSFLGNAIQILAGERQWQSCICCSKDGGGSRQITSEVGLGQPHCCHMITPACSYDWGNSWEKNVNLCLEPRSLFLGWYVVLHRTLCSGPKEAGGTDCTLLNEKQ